MKLGNNEKKRKKKKSAKGEWRKKRETKISKFYKKGTKVQRKISVQDKRSKAQPKSWKEQKYEQHSQGSYSI